MTTYRVDAAFLLRVRRVDGLWRLGLMDLSTHEYLEFSSWRTVTHHLRALPPARDAASDRSQNEGVTPEALPSDPHEHWPPVGEEEVGTVLTNPGHATIQIEERDEADLIAFLRSIDGGTPPID